ncbi:hypothetical protein AMJ57_01845 [Parcubacteria bacterium SG8_24]|nr:MAG: hypothetical protein AMJ57_01845 [Parcubacteria bacterium SG8_24]
MDHQTGSRNTWLTPVILLLSLGVVIVITLTLRSMSSSVPGPLGETEPPRTPGLIGATDWCSEEGDGNCLLRLCSANERTIVVFYADWCPWCGKLKKETLADRRVQEVLKGYARVIIEDGEKNAVFADALEIRALPTVIVLEPGCTGRLRIDGYVDADTLLEALKSRPNSE